MKYFASLVALLVTCFPAVAQEEVGTLPKQQFAVDQDADGLGQTVTASCGLVVTRWGSGPWRVLKPALTPTAGSDLCHLITLMATMEPNTEPALPGEGNGITVVTVFKSETGAIWSPTTPSKGVESVSGTVYRHCSLVKDCPKPCGTAPPMPPIEVEGEEQFIPVDFVTVDDKGNERRHRVLSRVKNGNTQAAVKKAETAKAAVERELRKP